MLRGDRHTLHARANTFFIHGAITLHPYHRVMNTRTIAALMIVTLFCASCSSNEQLQQRMDQRNDAYSNYNERRKIRTDARQERTDMWYDRHMN